MLVFWLIYRLKGHFAEFAPLDSKLQWCQYICSCWTTKYSRILDIVWTMCAWEIQDFLYFCIPRFAPSNWWLKTNTEIDWDRLFLQHPSVYSDIDIYIYIIYCVYIYYIIYVCVCSYIISLEGHWGWLDTLTCDLRWHSEKPHDLEKPHGLSGCWQMYCSAHGVQTPQWLGFLEWPGAVGDAKFASMLQWCFVVVHGASFEETIAAAK